jgi:hypothetical protein
MFASVSSARSGGYSAPMAPEWLPPLALTISPNVEVGSLAVALATLALAVITWRLARTATRSTEAAERSATVSERAAAVAERSADAAEHTARMAQLEVDSIDMPYVIATYLPGRPGGAGIERRPAQPILREITSDGEEVLRCRVLNIGSGPGIVLDLVLRSGDINVASGLPAHLPLSAGGEAFAAVPSPAWPPPLSTGELQVEYMHSNGTRYVTTSAVDFGKQDMLVCRTYERSLSSSQADAPALAP